MFLVKCFNILKFRLHFNSFRLFSIFDKNFEYFRNKGDYKNSVVQLNSDLIDCNLAGPGFSFIIKKQDLQTDGFFFHLMHRENVMKLSAVQIKEILCLMANARIDINKYPITLKYIDEKCALSVEKWPLDLSLYILDAWYIILGSKAFKKYYYSAITSMWSKKIKKCTKYNLILMLYFIGLSKTSPPFLMDLLEDKLEKYALELTDEEWAIVCLSFFKTSTRMKSDFLLKQACTATEDLIVKKERFHLISILKCLRLSRYNDINLIRILTEFVKREHASFTFIECTNFLACFATQNIYNNEVYECLEKQSIFHLLQENTVVFNKNVAKMHPSERIRVKDLARLLWGLSFVGHTLEEESLNVIIGTLSDRLNSGEFNRNIPLLIDCLQSLVLLNQYPQNLIDYVLNPTFKHELSKIDKAKPKYQLYFIYRSAFIENSKTEITNIKLFNHIPKSLEKDIKERKGFVDLINFLNDTSVANSFICCYIMPHIMISGITISTKHKGISNKPAYNTLIKFIESGIISKCIRDILSADKCCTCIEVLDSSVCINNTNEPLALMKTKIRQLQELNFDVITLTPEEIKLLKSPNPPQNCSKILKIVS